MREQLLLVYSYLHGIWRYRWSALLISGVIAWLGWMVVYAVPNFYTARTVVQVDTKSIMKPLLKGLAVDSEVEAGLNLMRRVLLSRNNLEDVIRQTDIGLDAHDVGAMDRLVLDLASSITLSAEKSSNKKKKNDNKIYTLSYEGKSPELVYQVVSKLLNTLIENTLESARTDTASAQKFLDRQISEYEDRLTSDEQTLAKFKQENVGFMPDERGGYYAMLSRQQNKLVEIRSELRIERRRHAAMLKQLAGETPLLGDAYNKPKVLKLRKYRQQLEELLTRYQEQHPDVLALKAIITDLVSSEDTAVEEVADFSGENAEFNPVYQELKADVHRARVKIETLKISLMEKEESIERLKKSVDVLPDVEAKLAKLNRDYDITRERYLDLVTRRESARLAQEVGLSGDNIKFRIIDAPRVPLGPSGPNRIFLISMVFLGAIAVGLGWGFLRYLLHPSFIDSSQLRDKIGLPILGSVGLYITDKHRKQRRTQLISFLMVFLLMVVSYGGVLMFHEEGSRLISAIISSGRSV